MRRAQVLAVTHFRLIGLAQYSARYLRPGLWPPNQTYRSPAHDVTRWFRTRPSRHGSADTDHDGMPDDYENSIPGLDANNPADATLDLDADGATNVEEYLAGTAPNDPTSVFGVDSLTLLPSGDVELRFEARANKAYSVLVSSTLEPGSWQKLTDVAAESVPRPAVVVTDSSPYNGGFHGYRVVTPPVP